MKKESRFEAFFKPLLVLIGICLIVSALLGFTHSLTAPVIEENARKAADETRSAVLPGAVSFTEVPCDAAALGITGAYKEDSGLGYVITAEAQGYKGAVTVTVGLDAGGKIVGLCADVSTETKGIGSKAGDSAYTDRFLGLTGSAGGVDAISNATYSSTAVIRGVDAALAAFGEIR